MLSRAIRRGISAMNIVGISLILIMAVLTTADVLLRKVANSPIRGTYELSEIFMATLVFLGIAYTQSAKGHVTVTLLTTRLRPSAQMVAKITVLIISIPIFGLMAWRASLNAIYSWQVGEHSGLLDIPIGPLKMLVPLGIIMLMLQLLVDVWDNMREFRRIRA